MNLREFINILDSDCKIIVRLNYSNLDFETQITEKNIEKIPYALEVKNIKVYPNGDLLILVEEE